MLTYRVCAATARKEGGRGALPQNNMRSTNYIRDKHRDKAGRLMASDVGEWCEGGLVGCLGCGS